MRYTHLIERQRPLVLQDSPCTMHHARVRPRRRRLHSLRVKTIGQPAPHPPTRIPLTTLTISNGWPTRTWSERASVLYSRCARHGAHLEDAADGAGRQVFCGARHGGGGAEKEGRGREGAEGRRRGRRTRRGGASESLLPNYYASALDGNLIDARGR